MNSLETFSSKATDNCSIVYLIDEDLCLGNSYGIINTNFESVSAEQQNLTTYANLWYNLYTTFSNNSSKWLDAIYNISNFSSQWESAYKIKESYKKYWDLPIYIIYPDFIDYTYYYGNMVLVGDTIKNWLNTNFPNKEYVENQVIDISVNLYTIKDFSYNFHRERVENCTPATGDSDATVTCKGCGHGDAGLCNHYRNKDSKQVIECHPVCRDCSVKIDKRKKSYTCKTQSLPQTLTLDYNTTFSDRYINRIISLRFRNNQITGWTQI